MIYIAIILGFASIFGVYWTIKTKEPVTAIITLGMVAGIILFYLPLSLEVPVGIYIYMGFTALAFLYGAFAKDKSFWSRLMICLITGAIFLFYLWTHYHWHGNVLLLPILALLSGVGVFFKLKNFKYELGFLVILLADAAAIILEQVLYKAY